MTTTYRGITIEEFRFVGPPRYRFSLPGSDGYEHSHDFPTLEAAKRHIDRWRDRHAMRARYRR